MSFLAIHQYTCGGSRGALGVQSNPPLAHSLVWKIPIWMFTFAQKYLSGNLRTPARTPLHRILDPPQVHAVSVQANVFLSLFTHAVPNASSVPHYKNSSSVGKQEACYCLSGFHGPSCQHYGCSPNPCLNGATCRSDNNPFTCTCTPGYHGSLCQHPCPQGFYGKNCSQKCRCSVHGSCDLATGRCSCDRGYNGTYCEKGCLPGFYGYNCDQRCQCRNGALCDPVYGRCNCSVGWVGTFCDLPCPWNTWGKSCSKNCSCSSAAVVCDRFTGNCICRDGYFGT